MYSEKLSRHYVFTDIPEKLIYPKKDTSLAFSKYCILCRTSQDFPKKQIVSLY